MPKRRKVVEVKVEVPDDYEATQIKTECESQEVKGTPENGDNHPFSRNLRPRKNKCYAEKESPELEEPERRVSKVPRRKRRSDPATSEDGTPAAPEPEVKVKKDPSPQKIPEKPKAKPAEPIRPPEPPKNILDAVNLPFRDIRLELENLQFPIPSAGPTLALASKLFSCSKGNNGVAETRPKPARKRPKKVALEHKIKTEPVETTSTSIDDYSELNQTDGAPNVFSNDSKDPTAIVPKPKRKRKKPQTATSDNHTEKNGDVLVKVEAEIKVDNDDEQVYDNIEGESMNVQPTKKVASRCKPKGKSDGSKPDGISERKESIDEDNQDQKSTNAAATKRPKNRPKPTPIASNQSTGTATTSVAGASVNDESVRAEDGVREDVDADDMSYASRRPFPRGRKSKLLSSRIGRKEVIHTDEAIDPADIRGFEHVERYVPPAGVRLPKFWDSEDEVSDDESNDNFRRIMCGFGTNCRIHEVIRPASEIVRRLKELQNTFGGTRTLPLFHHGSNEPNAENATSDGDAGDGGKKMPILWHNDPVYFTYANNFP